MSPFPQRGTMEYLGNNVIIVKGRLSLDTSTMPAHLYTQPQWTEESRSRRWRGGGVQINPFLRDHVSLPSFPSVSISYFPQPIFFLSPSLPSCLFLSHSFFPPDLISEMSR